MLKENEWNTINNMLLEIYSVKDADYLTEKILRMFRMVIPYTQGYYLVFDENNKINKEKSRFIDMDQETIELYLEHYYEVDYLKYLLGFSKATMTYRDTDILEEDIRKKTELYRDFLRPKNIPYGCGIILIKDDKMLGIINLFRSAEYGDFSDKDIEILDILKLHLRNISYDLFYVQQEKIDSKLEDVCRRYDLSEREQEVIKMMSSGQSNNEIGENLAISLSTVKKHFYNIYNKMGIKNRTQLMALIK